MTLHTNDPIFEAEHFITHLHIKIRSIIKQNFVGCYVHGSFVLGGFTKNSDVDLLIVTKTALSLDNKQQLAKLFLTISNKPYPIEITLLHSDQLKVWQHPCPYDFHFSEYWRDHFTEQFNNPSNINDEIQTDRDLAAHITIVNYYGICISGEPIQSVFPTVPKCDYIDALLTDFYDCIDMIEQKPVYSVLNMLRVYQYIKDNKISSKQQAGLWGISNLPETFSNTLKKALLAYENNAESVHFTNNELTTFKQHMLENVERL